MPRVLSILVLVLGAACSGADTPRVSARGDVTLTDDGRTTERFFTVALRGEAVRLLSAEGAMPAVSVEVLVAATNPRNPLDAGAAGLDGGVVTRGEFFERAVRVRLVRLRDLPRTAVELDYYPDAEPEKALSLAAFEHCRGESVCRESFRVDLVRLDEASDDVDLAFRVSATVVDPPMDLPADPLEVTFMDQPIDPTTSVADGSVGDPG